MDTSKGDLSALKKIMARMNVQTYIALGRSVMDMRPGLFPRIAAIGLAAASVLAFIQGLVAPGEIPFKDIIPRP